MSLYRREPCPRSGKSATSGGSYRRTTVTPSDWLYDEGVVDELAASMLANGFFSHEPLIVLRPTTDTGKYLVLEGNRRFAAISILLQLPAAVESSLAFDFDSEPDASQLARLRVVPTFVVENRDDVRKFLGFRHIGGTKILAAEAKARYITEEVERASRDGTEDVFREVGRRVGSNAQGVRGPYIALKILRAARNEFGIDIQYVLNERFGVWNRLMNSSDIRQHIGFEDARTLDEINTIIPRLHAAQLREVIEDLTPSMGRRKAILSDSRDVTTYAAVLRNSRARETLRKYDDLTLAQQVIERLSLGDKVRALARSVQLLLQDLSSSEIDAGVLDATTGLASVARSLNASVRDRLADNDD